jgi:Flp pilus assembly pilin Flp
MAYASVGRHFPSLMVFLPSLTASDGTSQPNPMSSFFRKLLKSEQGTTVIEYVLIASLISVAAIIAMSVAAAANV